MVFQYVTQFMGIVWNEIFSIPIPYLNNLTIKGFLIGNLIICWGIGIYKYFVNSFVADTDSIRREVNANKPRTTETVSETRSYNAGTGRTTHVYHKTTTTTRRVKRK